MVGINILFIMMSFFEVSFFFRFFNSSMSGVFEGEFIIRCMRSLVVLYFKRLNLLDREYIYI